jgi:light-regulated signal transduction histidine kinase (bacteriophytochrome)
MICAFTPLLVRDARASTGAAAGVGATPSLRGTTREREFEAFSHAVAHDLRAPLRVLDGYLNLLDEELNGGTLDGARDCLRRGQEAVTRMQAMIGRLMQLPQLHQLQLPRVTIDLGAMAAELIAEFRTAEPSRCVELQLLSSLTVEADPVLARILMQNLLANAWKYTNRESTARIVIGSHLHDEERVFFIEDNGVGFDPGAADRLFQPFQRLHPASDFEGTGIGLVTVHRIVDCHHGRIWAKGRPGYGATFFFTLQASSCPTKPATGGG